MAVGDTLGGLFGTDPTQLQDIMNQVNQWMELIRQNQPGKVEDYAWASPEWKNAIMEGLQSEGMDPASYAQAKQQIATGVGTLTGDITAKRGRGGYVDRESLGQAFGNAPATAASRGLAALESEKARKAAEDRANARRELGAQMQWLEGMATQDQEAFGDLVGQFQGMTPQVVPFFGGGGGGVGGSSGGLPMGGRNRIIQPGQTWRPSGLYGFGL